MSKDYKEYTSTNTATGRDGLLPKCYRRDGELFSYVYTTLFKLIADNGGKPIFIRAATSGNRLQNGEHKGKTGYVVQFSPFLFPRSSSQGSERKYHYFSEWDLVYTSNNHRK